MTELNPQFYGDFAFLGSGKFRGMIGVPNGKIYSAPYNTPNVLLITDPETMTFDTSVSTAGIYSGSQKWVGSALAPNGKIYCPTYAAGQILVIDPTDNSLSGIGNGLQCRSAATGLDGLIYMPPWAGQHITKVYPDGMTSINIPIELNTSGPIWSLPISASDPNAITRYWGAVAGPNEKIYGIPYSADRILIINTRTQEVKQGVDWLSGGGSYTDNVYGTGAYFNKYSGGVYSPVDGYIYGIPRRADCLLRIDPRTDRAIEIPMDFSGVSGLTQSKWFGGVLGLNGKIYTVPWGADSILEIDPYEGNHELIPIDLTPTGTTGNYFAGGHLHHDGRIFFTPWGSNSMLVINPTPGKSVDPDVTLARWINNPL